MNQNQAWCVNVEGYLFVGSIMGSAHILLIVLLCPPVKVTAALEGKAQKTALSWAHGIRPLEWGPSNEALARRGVARGI